MDSRDSEITILEEVGDRKRTGPPNTPRINGELVKEEQADSHLSCHGDDEIPDFDEADLEVLDCWEDADEACDNSTLEQENIVDKSTSPLKDVNSNSESNHKSRNARSASLDSVKTIIFEDLTNLDEAKSAQKSQPSEGGRVNPDDSRTSVKGDSALKSKHDEEKSCKKDDSKKSVSTRVSMDTEKLGHDGGAHQNSKKAPDKSGESPSKKPVKETPTRAKLNLPTDPTESKVDKFLKEMALQNSHIIGLQDVSVDSNILDSVSSESSKHSSHSPSPYTELADLPPGVDKEQSILDTTTSSLSAVASKAAESKQSIGSSSEATRHQKNIRIQNEDYEGGRGQKPHVSIRYRASDSSKGLGEKDRKSRSPSGKHLYKVSSSSRSPIISKNKKTSPARSFSISPSPSPRSRRLSRSPLPTLRVTQLIENFPSHKYVDRPHYQSPIETSRYHRSPPRDQANLRALSRSLSRERAQSRSRSKSRGRSYLRHRSRSRSRNRFSSKEERSRRYRRSSSRSRSPNRRMRSRSRSWSPQRYGRKRPSLTREDSRAKRARLSRSPSRSNSPWNIHVEVPLNEWHNTYEPNRNSSINDDVQLEHDMARFIATNIAATGLRPPVTDTRGWYDPVLKPRDTIPQSFPMEEPSAEAIRQGMGMPLPPPPPDISELMTAEEIKETGALGNMSPEVPAPSLSSLLESAVTGCPNNIILERCQDAIMKLHDVSFKPGRFVVIPSIKVPERKALSTFQLWQSVVNRLLPSKVHFNYCETTEPMVLWESSKPKPQRKPIESRSASSHTEVVPTPPSLSTLIPSSTADLDRAALLDKIFFLTRELQEVRDILDRKSVPKKHAGVQTTSVNLCETCCNSQRPPLPSRTIPVTSPSNSPLVTNRVRQRSSASSSSCQTQPVFAVHQSTYSLPVPTSKPVPKGVLKPQQVPASQPMPTPQSVPTPQPVPAPQPVPTPQPVPAPALLSTPVGSTQSTSISLPVPQPVPPPNQFHYSLSSTGVNTASNSLSTSSAPHGSSQSNNQLQSSSEEKTKASFGETSKPNISKSKKNPSIPPLIPGLVGSSKSNVPAAPVQATKPTVASGQVKSVVPATMSPMTSSDYDLRKYVLIGDEHGMDLRNYFLGTGMDFLFHPKLCTNGQSLDSVLKNVISCNNLCKQVVVFMGLYNSSYNSKSLDKFKQLIGYLRKRCKHLVVVEPPTIPKFQSMKSAWHLYSQLLETFQPFKSDNVSVVCCRQFLLLDNQTPNISMFSSPERLSHEGLRLIFEELKRTLEVKKTNSLWSGLNVR